MDVRYELRRPIEAVNVRPGGKLQPLSYNPIGTAHLYFSRLRERGGHAARAASQRDCRGATDCPYERE